MGGDNGCQGTCITDTRTEPKTGKIEGGIWGGLCWEGMVGGRWRQLYLNSNKNK